jgi:hypothetical protein
MSAPDILVREVKDPNVRGIFRSLNEVYPIGAVKPNSRYMGEVSASPTCMTWSTAEIARYPLLQPGPDPQAGTARQHGGGQAQPLHPQHRRLLGTPGSTTSASTRWAGAASARRAGRLRRRQGDAGKARPRQAMLLPIDHLATRIYSQNREAAILEYLTLTSYYYWGSYDIADQNSSTNVTKSVHHANELESPAKVFTAANHPYFVNHLLRSCRPTEAFVRNFGPRLHHIAVAVADGEVDGKANIDYVVQRLRDCGQKFLLDVIGSKEEGLKQIFSSASEYSSLIIEYVQRFGDFQGFFTKQNVAELTHAAGVEESLKALQEEARA